MLFESKSVIPAAMHALGYRVRLLTPSSCIEGWRRFKLSPLNTSSRLSCFTRDGRRIRCSSLYARTQSERNLLSSPYELIFTIRGCLRPSSSNFSAVPTVYCGQPHRSSRGLSPTRALSFATFVLPPANMEASARCVALGSTHNPIRIHSPILLASMEFIPLLQKEP